MRDWFGRIVLLSMGWYMAHSYALYPDDPTSRWSAIGVVTLGTVLIGFTCYVTGWERGRKSKHQTAAERGREEAGR